MQGSPTAPRRGADPVAAAREVAQVAAAHADEAEALRRLPPAVVDSFVTSGLAAAVAPSALGGWAAPPTAMVLAVETVSAADASAGWCVAIGMGSNFLAGYLPRDGAREVFADLRQPGSGPFAPTARGVPTADGYRVTGRWPFASGCQHAAVQASGMFATADGGGPEMGPDGPVHRLAFLRRDVLKVDETWDTTGLRATGSHHTEATDVAVPREHTMRLVDEAWSDDPAFQQPAFGLLAPVLAAVALGIGRAALDSVVAKAVADHEHPPFPGPRPAFGTSPVAQLEYGRAEVRLRAARALLLDVLHEGYELGLAGFPAPREHTALVGLASQEVLEAGAAAVDAACRLSGTAAVRDGCSLDRLRRDVDTMRQHVLFAPGIGAPYARQLAGIPTVAFPLLARPLG